MPGGQGDPAEPPLRLDWSFVKTRRGIILGAELLLQLLLFLCFAASATAFLTAPLIFLILNICFLLVYLTRYHQQLAGLSWPCTDFVRAVVSTLIFLILSIVSAARSEGSGMAAAAVFGFILTGLLTYDAYDLYRSVLTEQSSQQGEGDSPAAPGLQST